MKVKKIILCLVCIMSFLSSAGIIKADEPKGDYRKDDILVDASCLDQNALDLVEQYTTQDSNGIWYITDSVSLKNGLSEKQYDTVVKQITLTNRETTNNRYLRAANNNTGTWTGSYMEGPGGITGTWTTKYNR